MANCSYKLVRMPFIFLFMFFIFNAPNKVKEDSILSEHLASLFIVLSAIWECIVAEIHII